MPPKLQPPAVSKAPEQFLRHRGFLSIKPKNMHRRLAGADIYCFTANAKVAATTKLMNFAHPLAANTIVLKILLLSSVASHLRSSPDHRCCRGDAAMHICIVLPL